MRGSKSSGSVGCGFLIFDFLVCLASGLEGFEAESFLPESAASSILFTMLEME